MAKIKKDKTRSKAILSKVKIDEGETLHIGIDTHKRKYDIAIWSVERDTLLLTWVQHPSSKGLIDRLAPIRGHVKRIVYEAGPTGFSLARALCQDGWPLEVISAAHTPVAVVRDPKSDRIDAKKLAEYSSKDLLREVYVLTEQEESDRLIERTRKQVSENLTEIKQQIKSLLLFSGIAYPPGLDNWTNASVERLREMPLDPETRFAFDMHLTAFDFQKAQLSLVTKKLNALAREERFRKNAELLQTIPGVGSLTAMTFLLELPNPERFAGPRQVARMLGLSPEIRASGETRRETGRQVGGNRRLRTALVESAWQWIRRDAQARSRYNELLRNTGNPKKAIVGLARKLGIVLWRMLMNGESYCPGLLNTPRSVFEGMKQKAAKC